MPVRFRFLPPEFVDASGNDVVGKHEQIAQFAESEMEERQSDGKQREHRRNEDARLHALDELLRNVVRRQAMMMRGVRPPDVGHQSDGDHVHAVHDCRDLIVRISSEERAGKWKQ